MPGKGEASDLMLKKREVYLFDTNEIKGCMVVFAPCTGKLKPTLSIRVSEKEQGRLCRKVGQQEVSTRACAAEKFSHLAQKKGETVGYPYFGDGTRLGPAFVRALGSTLVRKRQKRLTDP